MRLRSNYLALLAALALSLWLLLPDEPEATAAVSAAETGPMAVKADLLGAEGRAAVTRAEPVLAPTARSGGREALDEAHVIVLSPQASPRVGLPVRILDPCAARPVRWVLTASKGRVDLGRVPLDGSVTVEVMDRWASPGEAPLPGVVGEAAILDVKTVIQCESGLWLGVDIVDAVSGRRLMQDPWVIAGLDKACPEGGHVASEVAVLPGESRELGIEFRDDGLLSHVAWDPCAWNTTVSRYAKGLTMVYPMRRHARVHVFAEEHDGTPTERAQVEGVDVATRTITGEKLESRPHRGGFSLRGVPFFRDEPIQVLLMRPPTLASPREPVQEECIDFELVESDAEPAEYVFPETLRGVAVGHGTLPHEWARLLVLTARFPKDENKDVYWGSGGGSSRFGRGCGCYKRPRRTGSVEVTVQRRSGAPAVGARVSILGRSGRTDLHGRVVLNRVREGEWTVRLSEIGLVPTTRTVEVRADRLSRVTLREAAGATLKVRVVDAQGEALPYALLKIPSDAGWVDLQDGVQRIDPFTDRQGRRTVRNFPAGTWTLKAHYGSRKGSAEVELTHGAAKTITLTVR